jgi:spermidine/putrescine transport system permease protein
MARSSIKFEWGKLLWTTYVVLMLAIVMLPVVVLVAFSFNADRFPSLPWKGSTLHWYREVARNRDLYQAIGFSVYNSLVVTALSLFVGSATAWSLLRARIGTALTTAACFSLPFLVPPLLLLSIA